MHIEKHGFAERLSDSFHTESAILLLGWPVYLVMYFLTEQIPVQDCHVVHCALDDMIPFNEYFAVFYWLWYVLVVGSLIYFFAYDLKNFKRLQIFIMVTQVIAILVYVFYPTVQTGRPGVIDDNIFCDAMSLIYMADTPTEVCPSLHAAYSFGLASVWTKRKNTPAIWKAFIVISAVMICLAVLFVKQHSVIDVVAAAAVSLAAEYFVFGNWHKAMFRLRKIKIRKTYSKIH